MKLSARNQLRGTIVSINKGPIFCNVKVDIGDFTVTSAITSEAAEELSLAVADEVTIVIKSTDVMIGKS